MYLVLDEVSDQLDAPVAHTPRCRNDATQSIVIERGEVSAGPVVHRLERGPNGRHRGVRPRVVFRRGILGLLRDAVGELNALLVGYVEHDLPCRSRALKRTVVELLVAE